MTRVGNVAEVGEITRGDKGATFVIRDGTRCCEGVVV